VDTAGFVEPSRMADDMGADIAHVMVVRVDIGNIDMD